MSWMDGSFFVDGFGGAASHGFSSATTLFNIFQALTSGSSSDGESEGHKLGVIVDMMTSIFIMAVAQYFYRFVTEVWPSWLLNLLKKLLCSHDINEAAAVDVFMRQPEELVFDNELLVVAIEKYVAHLLQSVEDTHQEDVVTDGKSKSNGAALRQSPQFLREAEYRYMPITMPHHGDDRDMVSTLRRCYRLVMLPVDGHSVEVEEGLTVCFQQQLVSTAALSACKIVPRRGGYPPVSSFLPINFDTEAPKWGGMGANCVKGVHGKRRNGAGGGGKEEEEEGEGNEVTQSGHLAASSSAGGARRWKKVPVRQAVFHCTGSKNGKERIMDFARRAYAWYIRIVKEPTSRYYFYLSGTELQQALNSQLRGEFDAPRLFCMRRYPFPAGRNSFTTLFFPQKPQLLSLLDEFKCKVGRFAVPGVPHQLVVLLHGSPGTGKTSTIRRVAAYLRRHIVALPIQYIQTNSALWNILSGGPVILDGEKGNYADDDLQSREDASSLYEIGANPHGCDLPVEQVVYVFEDIDVVNQMKSLQLTPAERHLWLTTSATIDGDNSEYAHTHHVFDPATDGNESNGGEGLLQCRSETENKVRVDDDDDDDDDDRRGMLELKRLKEEGGVEEKEETSLSGSVLRMNALRSYQKMLARDALSPEGMLHAIDGAFAPPGRVVIFTTNYPERLPSFFWKPGVLTLSLHMGDLDAVTAMELVEHYCHDALTPEMKARFKALFFHCETEGRTTVMNPAWLEHMLLLHDDIEEVLRKFERSCHL